MTILIDNSHGARLLANALPTGDFVNTPTIGSLLPQSWNTFVIVAITPICLFRKLRISHFRNG